MGEGMSFDAYSVDFPKHKKKRYKSYKKGFTRKFKKFEEKEA